MRGARKLLFHLLSVEGIIPADAGSTWHPLLFEHFGEDHPRRCGEHSDCGFCVGCRAGSSPQMRGARKLAARQMNKIGSSPQMRGARNFKAVHEFILRIIPADAGSTDRIDVRLSDDADHPRRCGEHGHRPTLL